MFSLIITIISIALVTALALATIYYGGSAFRQGGDAAKAAQFINEGQQLAGAVTISEAAAGTSLSMPTTQTVLTGNNSLASTIPDYATSSAASGRSFVSAAAVTDAVCNKVNDKATGSTTAAGAAIPATTPAAQVYGCTGASTGTGKVFFNF